MFIGGWLIDKDWSFHITTQWKGRKHVDVVQYLAMLVGVEDVCNEHSLLIVGLK